MQITDILAQMGGLQSIARELGLSEREAASGADALAPAILGGFKKQVQSQPNGFQGLGRLLGQLGGGGLLDQVLSPQPTDVTPGNELLGQIFGSRDVSRAVAQNASAQTGLDTSLLKKMLPMVAMAVAGYMARQAGATDSASDSASDSAASGGLGGLLGGLLGGQGAAPGATGRDPASPGLVEMLDMNRDGNPLEDILRMLGRTTR